MKVIFKDNEGVKVMIPAIDIDIHIIADKDVPAGIPYIIYDGELPTEPQETWKIDLSKPDGYGLTPEQFYEKYPDLKGWAVQ